MLNIWSRNVKIVGVHLWGIYVAYLCDQSFEVGLEVMCRWVCLWCVGGPGGDASVGRSVKAHHIFAVWDTFTALEGWMLDVLAYVGHIQKQQHTAMCFLLFSILFLKFGRTIGVLHELHGARTCWGMCLWLHSIALQLHCIALQRSALHCIAVNWLIALHCIALHCMALHCILHCRSTETHTHSGGWKGLRTLGAGITHTHRGGGEGRTGKTG